MASSQPSASSPASPPQTEASPASNQNQRPAEVQALQRGARGGRGFRSRGRNRRTGGGDENQGNESVQQKYDDSMLFVSPVPPSTTVEAFQALFKAYGQVKNFRPRGEGGFVTFTERGKGIAGRIIADSEKSRFKLGETELEIRTVRARKSKLRRARKGNEQTASNSAPAPQRDPPAQPSPAPSPSTPTAAQPPSQPAAKEPPQALPQRPSWNAKGPRAGGRRQPRAQREQIAPSVPGIPSPLATKRLANKVALVTGGAGGIGSAICKLFASEGAKVSIADIAEAEVGRRLVDEIESAGGVARYQQLDVCNEDQVKNWVEETAKAFGPANILVNNAAVFIFGSIDETSNEMWDRVFATNVKGYAFCAKYAVQQMRRVGGGSIINIASVSSFIGQPKFVPYNTSKGAVMQLTRCLAVDLGPENIRCNAVCPGTIETSATHKHAQKLGITFESLVKDVVKSQPVKRIGHINDVAYACLYLASDESAYVTGSPLYVDGGLLACRT